MRGVICRLWVPSSQESEENETVDMWRLASHVQLQYAQLMNQTGVLHCVTAVLHMKGYQLCDLGFMHAHALISILACL